MADHNKYDKAKGQRPIERAVAPRNRFRLMLLVILSMVILFCLASTLTPGSSSSSSSGGQVQQQAIVSLPGHKNLRDNSHVVDQNPNLEEDFENERRKNANLAAKVADLEQRHQADVRSMSSGNAAPPPPPHPVLLPSAVSPPPTTTTTKTKPTSSATFGLSGPTTPPGKYYRGALPGSSERLALDAKASSRASSVIASMQHTWSGYVQKAWGMDEVSERITASEPCDGN